MAKPLVQAASRELYANLLSTAHDGRGRNARYRQNQLYFLHKFLRTNTDKIRSAIKKDTSPTESELDIELGLSLAVIRNFYEKINFKQSIVDEYRVAKNQDNSQARIPYGIVLLRPTAHTRFYSIISATATALAAGNVVLLELETTVRSVDAFFRNEFKTYDGEAFAIATSRVEDTDFLGKCLVIDQTKLEGAVPHVLKHHPHRIAIAVVDRTSDLAKAAKAILKSKHSFQGTSPYAVDIVMINEWAKTRFLTQCDELLRREPWSEKKASRQKILEERNLPNEEEEEGEVLLEVNGIILSEIKRSTESLRRKSAPNKLRLITVSGLVDATTIASDLSTTAALYCFSSSQAAKYLGQYIDSHLRFVNQIPESILVGPTVPESCFVTDFRMRYDTNMMSRPAPEFIRDVDKSLANVYRQELVPVKAFKQHSGWDIGFFDRGVLIGAVTIGMPTLCLLSYGGYQGLYYAYSRLF